MQRACREATAIWASRHPPQSAPRMAAAPQLMPQQDILWSGALTCGAAVFLPSKAYIQSMQTCKRAPPKRPWVHEGSTQSSNEQQMEHAVLHLAAGKHTHSKTAFTLCHPLRQLHSPPGQPCMQVPAGRFPRRRGTSALSPSPPAPHFGQPTLQFGHPCRGHRQQNVGHALHIGLRDAQGEGRKVQDGFEGQVHVVLDDDGDAAAGARRQDGAQRAGVKSRGGPGSSRAGDRVQAMGRLPRAGGPRPSPDQATWQSDYILRPPPAAPFPRSTNSCS